MRRKRREVEKWKEKLEEVEKLDWKKKDKEKDD